MAINGGKDPGGLGRSLERLKGKAEEIARADSRTVRAAGLELERAIKLELSKPAEQWLPDVLRRTGFEVAELGLAAALRVRGLPWHHRDPFDRLLIAQTLEGGYTFVTHDDLAAYGAPLLRA